MGEERKTKGIVRFGDTFLTYYNDRYSETTVDKIDDFIDHVETNGVRGWVGKVGPSDRVPESYENRDEIIQKAQEHKLWHAHIGDPCFKETFHGKYLVSDWVIHFKYYSNYDIKLLELDYHKPMTLPKDKLLEE